MYDFVNIFKLEEDNQNAVVEFNRRVYSHQFMHISFCNSETELFFIFQHI